MFFLFGVGADALPANKVKGGLSGLNGDAGGCQNQRF